MEFLWPGFFGLLGLIPLLTALYVWNLRRKRAFVVRYSSLSLVRAAIPRYSRIKRHLPFALFLAALTGLVVALARPVSIVSIPTNQTTIILAMDVSLSMRSADIPPSRLEAAEAAALSFVQHQKSSTQIGIVAFAGFAELIQPPTTEQETLQAAIESLTLGRRTAIGSGILQSIDAIAEIDRNVAPSITELNAGSQPPPSPVPHGAYAPDIIVLLTDGVSNAGPSPLEAAQQAADRGIRIYPIGFGTMNGTLSFGNPGNPGNPGSSGGFGGGRPQGGFRTAIDEDTMKKIADMTGGEYHTASSADELQKVFQSLPTYLITKHEVSEISFLFAALGALLVGAAICLAVVWHPLPG